MDIRTNLPQNGPQVQETVLSQDPTNLVPQNVEEIQNNETPFYKEGLFWVLMVLLVLLAAITWFFVVPLFYKPLVADVQINGDDIRLHVTRLIAPKNGFLVSQKDDNGLPGIFFQVSPYILQGTYNDFYIPFEYDETFTPDYYKNMIASEKFYVFFFVDDGDGKYSKSGDTQVGSYLLNHKVETIIDQSLE